MAFEVFKLKRISEQVRNNYIRGDEERLEARLVHEDEERAGKEAEESARKKAEERVIAAAEAKAKEKADA